MCGDLPRSPLADLSAAGGDGEGEGDFCCGGYVAA